MPLLVTGVMHRWHRMDAYYAYVAALYEGRKVSVPINDWMKSEQ